MSIEIASLLSITRIAFYDVVHSWQNVSVIIIYSNNFNLCKSPYKRVMEKGNDNDHLISGNQQI